MIAIKLSFFLFIQAPGVNGINPGSNIYEFNTGDTSVTFYDVYPAPWFEPEVRIQCSYRMTVVETTLVSVQFYNGMVLEASAVVAIESTSWEIKTEYGYATVNVDPEDYNIRVSTSNGRRVDVKLTQDQADGRDEFQVAYDVFRQYAFYGAIVFVGVLYFLRDTRIGILDPHKAPPPANPQTTWSV